MTLSFAPALPTRTLRQTAFAASIAFAAIAGGCANDGSSGGLFTTGALGDAPAATPAAKVTADPVCVSLSSQIDSLRREGTVERLEKAADGKTPAVNVQRAALAKQTQLNKLNADFIAKCGPALPKSSVTASLATPAQPVAAKPATASTTKAVASKVAAPSANNSGVTVVPSTSVAPPVQQQ